MNRNILISAPIEFPVIEPNNWNTWWDMWYNHASILAKINKNHNSTQAYWKGFDIYMRDGADPLDFYYKSKNMNCSNLFPSLFDNLDKLPLEIDVVRVVSSISKVSPHRDASYPSTGIRTLLYDNNVRPNFYYTFNNHIEYQTLPKDTNTWMYNDHKSLHGSDFYPGHSKILIMYYGTIKDEMLDKNLEKNIDRYKDYVIYDKP